MTIVFTDAQSDAQRLGLLLDKALALEHPGIDPEGIATMKGFIAAGRFPHSHYINMWSKRLEEGWKVRDSRHTLSGLFLVVWLPLIALYRHVRHIRLILR